MPSGPRLYHAIRYEKGRIRAEGPRKIYPCIGVALLAVACEGYSVALWYALEVGHSVPVVIFVPFGMLAR